MPRKFSVGDKVFARWPGTTTYYPGTVQSVDTSSLEATLVFEDGTDLEDIPFKHMRAESTMRPSRSRSVSRGRSRSRSRGRSKSPSRTKAKQSPSPTRKPRSKSSTKVARQSLTPTRQSTRIRDIVEKQESVKVESTNDKSVESKEEKPATKDAPSSPQTYEFGGPLGAIFMIVALPVAVLGINLACNRKTCSLREFPNVPLKLSTFVDRDSALLFFGWIAFQALLAIIPVGRLVKGQNLKSNGKALSYRCNGFLALVVTYAVLTALIYLGYNVTIVYAKFFKLAVIASVASFVLSVYLYVRSRNLAKKYQAEGGNTGSLPYDFFMGSELNPRVGPLDLKFFFELRPGLIGWSVLNTIFVYQAYTKGSLSPALAAVAVFQNLYVADALFFEPSILSTMDIVHDGFGYMLAFGDIAWVPFLYCLQTKYLVSHPQTWHPALLGAIVLLNFVGYLIFRGSNSQKDSFRRDPHNPIFANFNLIPTQSGKKLLASGWWGLSRHPNYLGDLIMALAWSLPCGFAAVLPYFYPIYFLVLLVHRARRDDAACRRKYGAAWDRYCREVRYRIIPYVY